MNAPAETMTDRRVVPSGPGAMKADVLEEVAARIATGEANVLDAHWLRNIAAELRSLKGPRHAFLTERREA